MNASETFAQRLRAIGYDGMLDQTGLEHLFQDDETSTVMSEVADVLTSDCVLTAEELAKLESLEKEGHVLHIDSLRRGLADARHAVALALFPGEEQQEVEHLSSSIELGKKQVHLLEAQRDQLSRHLSRIRKRNSELAPAIENAGQGMDKVLHKSWEDNSLINEAINDLEKSAHSLVALHTTIPDDKEQTSHFLAHQDFTHHEASENEYMERLTSYTKKQFFDGVAQLAGRKEGSRYELLNVGDPDSLLVKGESETVKAGYSRELARLQSVYALSQGQRIDALTARAKVNAACRSFNHQIESLDIEMIKDVQTLRTELEESQQKLAELKEETSQVTDTEMTPLLDELATLQQTCVLRGDYELKQARQDYFMSKQDKVIFYLLQQRGRHEFLSMALEREGRELRDSHRLLAATEAHLSAAVQTKEATELAMSHLNLKAPDQTRATLDSRDASMNRLFAMLELECKHGEKHQQQQLFSTYKQMLDNVTALQQQFDAIKSRTLATELTRQVYVSQLEQSLQQCLDLAFSNSKTITITEQLEKLNEIVGSLEKSIKEIVHSWNEKKKMVSSSPLLAAERELWVLFYTNTSKLRQIVADLGTRVQTHQH